MKNHQKVNGKLIQTNKKWSHLKERQKESISLSLKKRYEELWFTYKKLPSKSATEELLSDVYKELEEKGIWIPFHEVESFFSRKKHKWNLQNQRKIESQITE